MNFMRCSSLFSFMRAAPAQPLEPCALQHNVHQPQPVSVADRRSCAPQMPDAHTPLVLSACKIHCGCHRALPLVHFTNKSSARASLWAASFVIHQKVYLWLELHISGSGPCAEAHTNISDAASVSLHPPPPGPPGGASCQVTRFVTMLDASYMQV